MTSTELRPLFRQASIRHKQLRDKCQHHSPHAMATVKGAAGIRNDE